MAGQQQHVRGRLCTCWRCPRCNCVFNVFIYASMTSSWIRVQRDVPLCAFFSSVCAWSHVCDVVRQGYPAAVYFPAHAGYISKRTFFSSWSILGFLRMLFIPLGLCACFLVQKFALFLCFCACPSMKCVHFSHMNACEYACVSYTLYICVCVSVHIHMHFACKQMQLCVYTCTYIHAIIMCIHINTWKRLLHSCQCRTSQYSPCCSTSNSKTWSK